MESCHIDMDDACPTLNFSFVVVQCFNKLVSVDFIAYGSLKHLYRNIVVESRTVSHQYISQMILYIALYFCPS